MADTPEEDRAEAAADIQENGAPFHLERVLKDYNPATARTEEGPKQAWDGYAADWQYRTRDIDGSLVRVGDVRLIVAALTSDGEVMPAPQSGDVATYAGQCMNVMRAESIRKAGVAIAFDVQLRRP